MFIYGGGVGYFRELSFGYILGFLFAGWICGSLVFKVDFKLELLIFNCLCGLLSVYVIGLVYLIIGNILGWNNIELLFLFKVIFMYFIYFIFG